MSELVSILAFCPELITLLSSDNFMDFILYESSDLTSLMLSEDMFQATKTLFKLDDKDFSKFSGVLQYPSLIHLQFYDRYHGVILCLSNDKIYYTDCNLDRENNPYLILSLTEEELLDWLEQLKNPSAEILKKLLRIDCDINLNKPINITVAPITDYYQQAELLQLMDNKESSIIDYCVNNPERIYECDMDPQVSSPLMRDLILNKSQSYDDQQLLIYLIKYYLKKNIEDLKSKIVNMYKWI